MFPSETAASGDADGDQARTRCRHFGEFGAALAPRRRRVMKATVPIKWLSEPEDHDYPAAESYLSLIYDAKTVAGFIARLKKAPIAEFKEIGRASCRERG